MGTPFAEVIGDPIAQSKSPLIYKRWLAQIGLDGDYRSTRVAPADLAAFLATRRADPDWRGCNVTIPHKQAVMPLLEAIVPGAQTIGSVNCVGRDGDRLVGHNSDIDGVAAALSGIELRGAKTVMIGAGGGALAALRYLLDGKVESIHSLVRDPVKAASLRDVDSDRVVILPLSRCSEALVGSKIIINASPLGMHGAVTMPTELLAAVAANAAGATIFDMVYHPLETALLATARAHGGKAVDGLTMLIGQARAAFTLFFDEQAPHDGLQTLRDILTSTPGHRASGEGVDSKAGAYLDPSDQRR